MNSVCFCALTQAMQGRADQRPSAHLAMCCRTAANASPTDRGSPNRQGCGGPSCPRCPGSTPMVSAAKVLTAPPLLASVDWTLLPAWRQPAMSILASSRAVDRRDLIRAWTDPPTLFHLGCSRTS